MQLSGPRDSGARATTRGVTRMLNWWVELFAAGFGGAIVAVLIAALVVLAVANAVIWLLAGIKHAAR